jgi:hypothetical protein
MIRRCTFEGCYRSTESPGKDEWSYLEDWGPGVRDGFYYKPHADALEELLMSGEIEVEGTPKTTVGHIDRHNEN